MRFSNLARPGFDGRIVQIGFFDDRPATESLVAPVWRLISTRRSTSSSKRFLVAVARASSSASKITLAGTPFSLDTDSTTSSTSLLIVRLAFRKPLDPRDPRLSQNWE
jgi:hypothetical protein